MPVRVSPEQRTPRRVLLATDCVGGVWQYSLELASGLAAADVEVVLAVAGPAPTPAKRAEAEAIPGLRLRQLEGPLDWTATGPAELAPARTELLRLADDLAVDLVHLNGAALGDLDPGRKVVATHHSCLATWWQAMRAGEPLPDPWRWHREQVANGMTAADAVIVPSAAFAHQVRQAYGANLPLQVVHNGRAASASRLAPRRQAVVLTAGRLWDEAKNLRLLDGVAAGVHWPVLAVGPTSGPAGQHVQLTHAIALGSLENAALADRLRRAPIFTSLAIYEPFGLAVLEAALAGCALVLSDIATFREVWDEAALFVPADDAHAAHDAINRLIADPGLRARQAAEAKRRAADYTPAAFVSGTLAVYQRVLADVVSGPASPSLRAAG